MANIQTQTSSAPRGAGAASHASPFLMEPDSAQVAGEEISAIGESGILRKLEQLTGAEVRSEADAFELVDPLLLKIQYPATRAVVIRALRTTSGVDALSFDKVRTKALEALHPYVADTEVLYLFLQEIEGHQHNTEACKAAAEGINRAGVIEDPEACERIIRLVAESDYESGPTEALKSLSPILVHPGVEERSAGLIRSGDQKYRHRRSAPEESLRAMALSGSEAEVSKLTAWGAGEVYQRLKWELGLIWPAWIEAGYLGVMGMVWLGAQPASGPTTPFTAIHHWPMIALIGGAIGLLHSTLRYFSHPIENDEMSYNATRAMRFCFRSPSVQACLGRIASNEELNSDVRSSAKEVLEEGRSIFLVNCLNGLANHSKKAEEFLRSYQGVPGKTPVAAIITTLMRDRDPAVQEAAYRTADRIGSAS